MHCDSTHSGYSVDNTSPLIDVITAMYSLLPPLEPGQGDPKKFGSGAVNINSVDRRTQDEIRQLRLVLQKYESLWEDRIGRVIQLEEEWLEIPLKEGAVIESKGKYRVSKCDEALIDETFDRARADGRMSAVQGVVSAGWPCFVVWQKGKGRVVIDLRSLNDQVVKDAYPLPMQQDIIGQTRDKDEISAFDLVKAFYQFILKVADRWKTTIVSHRGQEMLNVAPMGFINSPSHTQKLQGCHPNIAT